MAADTIIIPAGFSFVRIKEAAGLIFPVGNPVRFVIDPDWVDV